MQEKLKKLSADHQPQLEVATRCHIGVTRERNEDSCYTFVAQTGGDARIPLFALFIVADGMGGHYDGHQASKIATRTVAQHVLDRLYRPLLSEPDSGAQAPVQEVLEEAVAQANRALINPDPQKLMGTTMTAALILAGRLFVVHVGDSRAYLVQDGELRLLTTDHSVVQALQDAGQITAAEAAVHPERNLLYRALMGEELEQVDTFTRTLPKDGTLMLCSDGLWGLVPDPEMAAVLGEAIPLQEKADRLLRTALEAGGNDNVTLVVVNFSL